MDVDGGMVFHRCLRERLFIPVGLAEFAQAEHWRRRKHYAKVATAILPQYVREYRCAAGESCRQSLRCSADRRRHGKPAGRVA